MFRILCFKLSTYFFAFKLGGVFRYSLSIAKHQQNLKSVCSEGLVYTLH